MDSTQNILVVLPMPIGDAILATPALRRLRQSLPAAHITCLARPPVRDILAGSPCTNAWLTLDQNNSNIFSLSHSISKLKCDAAILLTNSFCSAFRISLAHIKRRLGYNRQGRGILLTDRIPPFRLLNRFVPLSMIDYYNFLIDQSVTRLSPGQTIISEDDNNRLELFTNDQDRRCVDDLFTKWSFTAQDPLAIIIPGAAFGPSKCWPADYFAQLADSLSDKGFRVIISCAPNQTERALAKSITSSTRTDVFNLTEANLSLSALKELIRRCCLMIANDTGPCHIAAAFDVPLLTLFGPTDPRWTVTGYQHEIRLTAPANCPPCQKPKCSRDHRCLTDIKPTAVLTAAEQLLSRPQKDNKNNNSSSSSQYEPLLTDTFYQPFSESFEPLSSGLGLIHKNYKTLLQKNKLACLEDIFASSIGEKLIKPSLGPRERLRLVLKHTDGTEVVLYMKRYGHPGPAQLLKRRLTFQPHPQAEYDFAHALSLAEHNIPVARPLAWGCQMNWLGEQRSFVIFEQLPSGDALERILPQWSRKENEYKLLQDRDELIIRLAQLACRLHESGFCHRDLYISHIFLTRDRFGEEKLCLIDLRRVFRPRLFRLRWRIKDLAQFYYSARNFFSPADMDLFWQEYFQTQALTTLQQWIIQAVYSKARRIAKHDHKHRQKNNNSLPQTNINHLTP